jgi:rRNA maturation protein Nop10
VTRVVCGYCGAPYALASDFELEGECRECGEEALVAEDAYDPAPDVLVCVVCRRELAGGPVTQHGDEWNEGRYTVDDPCPLCGGELVPRDSAPPLRSRPELGLARRVAQKLRREAGVEAPWCEPAVIAERAGFAVVLGSFAHQGMLVDGETIEIPESEPRVAQRFAIAHELGHAVLRHQVPEGQVEQEANAFASELLIPRDQLRNAVTGGRGFRAMARIFEVSHQALGWALAGAGLTEQVRDR